MRLLLTLQHRSGEALPINYSWLISSWIYRTLEKASPEFSHWLHDQGFGFESRNYKLFTFSPLQPQRYRIDRPQRAFVLTEGPTRLILSFYIDEALQHFVMGLFKDQTFSLQSGRFRVDFTVQAMRMLSRPEFQSPMRFRLLTPLCVSYQRKGEKYPDYLHPADPGYAELLIRNLLRKRAALQTEPPAIVDPKEDIGFPYSFECLSEPKSKLLSIKGIQVRGYLFDFMLAAPAELLEMGYYAGFGEKNSGVGMGMVSFL
jgi:CRISPR-associated endoribonuclease Cas6